MVGIKGERIVNHIHNVTKWDETLEAEFQDMKTALTSPILQSSKPLSQFLSSTVHHCLSEPFISRFKMVLITGK